MEFKYFLLTDFNILTPSISEQINQLVIDNQKLKFDHSVSDNYEITETHNSHLFNRSKEEIDLYWHRMAKIREYHAGQIQMKANHWNLSKSLEDELFSRLPKKIKKIPVTPYFRVQTFADGDYFYPHADSGRKTSLITPVKTYGETTWWWKQNEKHEMTAGVLPDIDLLEKTASARAEVGETWLFDIDTVHSIERPPQNTDGVRITIQWRWGTLSLTEILKELI